MKKGAVACGWTVWDGFGTKRCPLAIGPITTSGRFPILFPINKPPHLRHFSSENIRGNSAQISTESKREKRSVTAKAVRVKQRRFRWVLSRGQVKLDRKWIPEERRRPQRRVWGLPNTRLRYWMQTKYKPPVIIHPDGSAVWSMSGWLHLLFLFCHYISSLIYSEVIYEYKLTITPPRLG